MTARYDNLLFVVFLRTPLERKASQLWADLFGSEPDNFNQLPQGTHAQSIVDGVNFSVAVSLPRIDITISPVDTPGRPGYFDDPGPLIERGIEASLKIADQCDVERFAVVFQTTDETPTIFSAVKNVADTVGLPSVPAEAEEVQVQIVVPKASNALPGTNIQRLIRWFSARKIMLGIQAGMPNLLQPGPTAVPSVFGAAGYADVFTAPGVVVPSGAYEPVMRELAEEAQRILSNGYAAID